MARSRGHSGCCRWPGAKLGRGLQRASSHVRQSQVERSEEEEVTTAGSARPGPQIGVAPVSLYSTSHSHQGVYTHFKAKRR